MKGKSVAIAKPLSFSPSVQHAKNTDTMIECEECNKKKLSAAARTTQSLLEDVSYTMWSIPVEDLHLLMGIQVVIRDHRYGDPIEKLYYSAGYEDICCIR